MKYLAHLLIRFYQKFISPYKGFRCAHAALHGGESCSEAVLKIVMNQGVFGGYGNVRKRFDACTNAFEQLQQDQQKQDKEKRDKRQRRGWCGRRREDAKDFACQSTECMPQACSIADKSCDIGPCDCNPF